MTWLTKGVKDISFCKEAHLFKVRDFTEIKDQIPVMTNFHNKQM